MHSRIFQLSRNPIEKEDYIIEDDCYEYIYADSTWDYVSDIDADDDEYDEEYEWLGETPGIAVDVKNKTLTIVSKEAYFQNKYAAFKERLRELSNITFDEFCTGEADVSMYALNEAYRDKHGFYIVCDDGGFMPIDAFVRSFTIKEGDVFYLGGVIDYHY